jgi:hypothetical protein
LEPHERGIKMSRSYKKHPVTCSRTSKFLKRLSSRNVRHSDDPIDARAKVDSWDIKDYTSAPMDFNQYLNKRLADFKAIETRQGGRTWWWDKLYEKLLKDRSLSVTEEVWKEWNKWRRRK